MKTTNLVILVLTIIAFFLLLIFIFLKDYKKNNKKVFTIRKISFLAIMLAISVGLSFFSIPIIPQYLKVSLDYVPIIVVGFLTGPLEAILFGFISDSIILLSHGWIWQFFMAIQKPLIGLMAWLSLYFYSKNIKFKYEFLLLIVFLWIVLVTSCLLIFLMPSSAYVPTDNLSFVWGSFSMLVLSFLITLFTLFHLKKEKSENIHLFIVISFLMYLSRMVNSWFFSSLAMYQLYSVPFELGLVSRIITTSFIAPINIWITFFLLKNLIPIFDRMWKPEIW